MTTLTIAYDPARFLKVQDRCPRAIHWAEVTGLSLKPHLRRMLEKMVTWVHKNAATAFIWPSQQTLANQVGEWRETSNRTIAELEECRLIKSLKCDHSSDAERYCTQDDYQGIHHGYDILGVYDEWEPTPPVPGMPLLSGRDFLRLDNQDLRLDNQDLRCEVLTERESRVKAEFESAQLRISVADILKITPDPDDVALVDQGLPVFEPCDSHKGREETINKRNRFYVLSSPPVLHGVINNHTPLPSVGSFPIGEEQDEVAKRVEDNWPKFKARGWRSMGAAIHKYRAHPKDFDRDMAEIEDAERAADGGKRAHGESTSEAEELGEAVKAEVKASLNEHVYNAWVRDMKGHRIDVGVLEMTVATPFELEWLERRLYRTVLELVQKEGADVGVQDVRFLLRAKKRGID